MRILYTHRTQGVGAEGAHIKGMYEAFRDLGHETSMLCLPGCNPAEAPPVPAGAEAGVRTPPRKPGPAPKRLYRIIADQAPQILFEGIELAYNGLLFLQLARRCLRNRPALIYERYSLNTFAPSLLCRLLGIKHVLEVNDSVVIERSRPLELRAVSSFLEGCCLRSADLSITITERFRRQLLDRFGARGIRIEVMTNAVTRRRFDRGFDREAVRRALGLEDAIVLGGAGQFLEWHGLADLVERLGPEAKARNLRFLFVGDGPARADVMAKAEALGVADRVHFTGMLPIDAVPGYLAVFDIAVIPKAAAHASPMKLIEYMAMGLPIVAPDLPSVRAALMDGSMGRIFPAGNMSAMKDAILDLMADRESARALGLKARAHVFAELTWDRHAGEILAILGLP
ncbi:MAG TPA: glycosyltransferase family 4 protein [Fibrobacteria bacterium]|nr:glycosyltransferase family 4 protein [Fibrobacteria bacterium]